MAFKVVQSTEPEKITAGDSVSWKKSFPEYLATAGWVLTYALVLDAVTSQQITITATPDVDDHLVELTFATTAGYPPGTYHYQSYLTNAALGERYKGETGQIEIEANYATMTTGLDARSHNQIVYENLKVVVENKSKQGDSSFSVEGRAVSKMPWEELLAVYSRFKSLWFAEKRKASGKTGRRVILSRFS